MRDPGEIARDLEGFVPPPSYTEQRGGPLTPADFPPPPPPCVEEGDACEGTVRPWDDGVVRCEHHEGRREALERGES